MVLGRNGEPLAPKGSANLGLRDADVLLTVKEVAEILRVPVSWVYERTRRRGFEMLPYLKVGKYLRFRLSEVQKYLEKLRHA